MNGPAPARDTIRVLLAPSSTEGWGFAASLLGATPGVALDVRSRPEDVVAALRSDPDVILVDAPQAENRLVDVALARRPAAASVILLCSPEHPVPPALAAAVGAVDVLQFSELTTHRVAQTVESCRRHARAQRALEAAADRSPNAGEAISSITGGIAHEINNVLTIIMANIELLPGERGQPDEESITREIRDAARRGSLMTAKMLKLSRHDEPKPAIQPLSPLLKEIVTTLRPILREDIELETFGEHLEGYIDADANSVHQIALNLVNNAMDAMPDGGLIRIGLRATRFDSLFCAAHPGSKPGRYLALIVEDTGTGMDEETLRNVFEPFFTTKPPGRGTGLGMAVVYGLTKQFNGYVDVYSEPGQGTQFLVHFPRVERKARVSGTHPVPAGELQRGQETVLLVEDEPHVRQVGQRILERLGYSVVTATNGQEGLEVLEEQAGRIDLVFTDVVMPILGGRDMYSLMQQQGWSPPVVFTSGYSHDSAGQPIADKSPHPFLRKPWSMEALATEVRNALDQTGRGPERGHPAQPDPAGSI